MRSFALLSLVVALGSAACNDQESVKASDTETTTSATTGPEPTTGTSSPGTASTTTTGEPATTTGMTTEPMLPTTGPGTTTSTTAPETTTTTTTTGEPGTTSSGTTEGAAPESGPYENCSNEMGIECMGTAVCVDGSNTNGQVDGSYCAPKCNGDVNNCQKPKDAGPNTQAICAFDTDMDMEADICALICNLAADDCGNGSACEDIGIPEMDVNGVIMKFGVCTYGG